MYAVTYLRGVLLVRELFDFKIPNESEMYQLNFKAFDHLLKTICSNDNESVNTIPD